MDHFQGVIHKVVNNRSRFNRIKLFSAAAAVNVFLWPSVLGSCDGRVVKAFESKTNGVSPRMLAVQEVLQIGQLEKCQ